MYWTILIIAGLLEAGWATSLRYSEGFTKLWPTVITVILMAMSMGMLSYVSKELPIGTAYVAWTGIGAVSTVILGLFIFNEPLELTRILYIIFIISGVIGLHSLEK